MGEKLPSRHESTGAPAYGFAVRLLPSLTDVILLFPLLFAFFHMQGVSTLLGDGDTGWHIRTGDWILLNGRVPHADVFSFSKSGQPWFAWEWAWDVSFALIHQAGGLGAVAFVNFLLLGLIFAFLFRLVRWECSNDLVASLVTLLALAATSIHWLARPHLVSWLFILIFCHILGRAAKGRPALLWCLPFLMVLWTNLHGGFFVGIAMVFVYGADPLAQGLRECGPRRFHRSAPFALCGLACAAVSFINPYGYNLHQHVIAYLLDSKQLENIMEFQSISFHTPISRYFEVMLAVGTISCFQNLHRKRFAETFLILAWAHLALVSVRNIPIFLFFAAPAVARTLSGWLDRFPSLASFGSEFSILERLPRFHVLTVGVFALLFFAMSKPGAAKLLRAEYDPAKYPSQAVEHLPSTSPNVFTDDEWGDYLIYRMYPSGRVFVDGRSDFYGADFESRYLEILNVRYDWESRLDLYGINTMLLRVEAPLSGALKESRHWRVVYDDGVALIFVRKRSGDLPLFANQGISPSGPDKGKRL